MGNVLTRIIVVYDIIESVVAGKGFFINKFFLKDATDEELVISEVRELKNFEP